MDCGFNYTIERGAVIKSKNYPNDYDNNLRCQYIIYVEEEGFYPQLDFVDVALASGDTISVSC